MSNIKIEKTDRKTVSTPATKNKLETENNPVTSTTSVQNQYCNSYTTSDLQNLQAAQQAQLLASTNNIQTSSASVLDNSSTSISTAAGATGQNTVAANTGLLATTHGNGLSSSGLGSSGTTTSNSMNDAAVLAAQNSSCQSQQAAQLGLTTADTSTALAMAHVGLGNNSTGTAQTSSNLYGNSTGITSSNPYGSLSTNPYAGLTSTGLNALGGVSTGALGSTGLTGTSYDPTGMSSMGSMASASAFAASSAAAYAGYGGSYGYDMSDGVRRKNATRESTNTLKAWLNEHKKNPYPTKGEKIMLAIITKMTLTQVSTWFANARRRLKKENKMTWVPKNRSADDASDKSDNEEETNLNENSENNVNSQTNGLQSLGQSSSNQNNGLYAGIKTDDYGNTNAFYNGLGGANDQESTNLNATSNSVTNSNIWGTNIKTENNTLSQTSLTEVPQNSGLFAATQQALGGVGAQNASANAAAAAAYQNQIYYNAYNAALAQSQNSVSQLGTNSGLLAANPYAGVNMYGTTTGVTTGVTETTPQNEAVSQQQLAGLDSVGTLQQLNSPSQPNTNIYANTATGNNAYSNPYLNAYTSQTLALGDGAQYQVQDAQAMQSGQVNVNGTGQFPASNGK